MTVRLYPSRRCIFFCGLESSSLFDFTITVIDRLAAVEHLDTTHFLRISIEVFSLDLLTNNILGWRWARLWRRPYFFVSRHRGRTGKGGRGGMKRKSVELFSVQPELRKGEEVWTQTQKKLSSCQIWWCVLCNPFHFRVFEFQNQDHIYGTHTKCSSFLIHSRVWLLTQVKVYAGQKRPIIIKHLYWKAP